MLAFIVFGLFFAFNLLRVGATINRRRWGEAAVSIGAAIYFGVLAIIAYTDWTVTP